MPPSVALHLGFHKSGTTYLQDNLDNNAELLGENKIAFLSAKQLRTRGFNFKAAEEFFHQYLTGDYQRVVVSEENLIGTCDKVYRNEVLYPHFSERLRRLAMVFRDCEVELFFGVRDVGSYLSAAYIESLRQHDFFFSFLDYTQRLHLEAVAWGPFIQQAREVFQNSNIYVWDIGLIRDPVSAGALIDTLLGRSIYKHLNIDSSPVRPSMPAVVVESLKIMSEILDRPEYLKYRGMVDSRLKFKEHEKFMPWTALEQQFWLQRHAADLMQMAAMPNVTVLGA